MSMPETVVGALEPVNLDTTPRRAHILDPAAIERKLALNTYNVDASRAHIRIIDHEVCLHCVRQPASAGFAASARGL